jgi:hypothetical protein
MDIISKHFIDKIKMMESQKKLLRTLAIGLMSMLIVVLATNKFSTTLYQNPAFLMGFKLVIVKTKFVSTFDFMNKY